MFEWYWLNFLISLLVSYFKIFHEQTSPGMEVSMNNIIEQYCQNGTITQFQLKMQFFHFNEKTKSNFFLQKYLFLFSGHLKRLSLFAKVEFWPIFYNMAQWHFFLTPPENKMWFFSKKKTPSYLLWNLFSWLQYYPENILANFVIASKGERF